MINNNRKYESLTNFNFENFYNFFKDFIAEVFDRSSSLGSRLDKKYLKTYSGLVALLNDNFI